MKNKQRGFWASATSLLLCAVMLLGYVPTVAAQGRTVAPIHGLNDFDFSVPLAENNKQWTASELFEKLFSEDGVVPTNEELAYLDERLYTLTYNDTIPSDAVETHYDRATGNLTVTVPIYTYTAQNGTEVQWVPQSATLDGETEALVRSGSAYECRFDGLDYEEDFDIEVTFKQTVTLSEEAIRTLLTQSKTDGEAAAGLLAEYAEEQARYQTAYAAYRAYIEYPSKRAARDQYDRLYAEYLEKKAEYDAYVAEEASYGDRLAAYEEYLRKKAEFEADWLQYEDYQKALEKYNKEYNEYTKYANQLAPAQAQIAILESLFVSDSHHWQLYATILGPTVSMVLARQEEMNIVGKGPQVEAAGEATEVLRTLLTDYNAIRTAKKDAPQSEREQALHQYYRANYAAIKESFRKLYNALYNLYSEGIVSDYIAAQGKEEHYQQFLGQLYITVCCLDDSEALTMNWTPTTHWKERTLDKVVEACQILKDTVKADPSETVYPTQVVTEPEKPEEVKAPVAPTVVHEPDVPVPVDCPTEPPFVEDPGAVSPPVAPDPGAAPKAPDLSYAMQAWAGIYVEVDYEAREALIRPRTLELTATMTRRVSAENLVRVRFYSYDGTLLDTVEYAKGADPSGMIMPQDTDRNASSQYVYEFAGWYRFDGTAYTTEASLSNDLSLRATYHRYQRSYTVTWIIDGRVDKTEEWDYGTTPVYNVPNKIDGKYDLIFSGWSPAPAPVTGNATYSGYYTKSLRMHEIIWRLAEGKIVEIETLAEGTIPEYRGAKDFVKDNKWYAFAGWDTPIVPALADATYVATYHNPVYFSTDASGKSNVNVSVKNGVVTAELLGNEVDFANLCAFAENCGYELALMRNTVSIKLNATALSALRSSGCQKIRFARAEQTMENGTGYALEFLGADGKVQNSNVTYTVQYRYTAIANGKAACYEYANGAWKALEGKSAGGIYSATRTGGGIFWCGMAYYVEYEPIEGLNTLKLPSCAVAGETVVLDLAAAGYEGYEKEYEITEILVTLEDGSVLTVEGNTFVMPSGAARVSLTVERIVYHVSFVVNGVVIAQGNYYYGDRIKLPETPTLDLGDGMVYSFIGWSPEVELAGGDSREIVYTAQFMSSAPITEEEQRKMESNTILTRVLVIGVAGLALLGGVIALIIFLRRRR